MSIEKNTITAQPGNTSSLPNWMSNINWKGIASNTAGNLVGATIGELGTDIFGNSSVGQSFNGAVSNVASLVGSQFASNLISGNNIGSGLNNLNFTGTGYGLAGGLLGSAIGGDGGQAVGTAISSIPRLTKGIKTIQDFNKGKQLASQAGSTLTKAGKITLLGNYANIAGIAANVAGSFLPTKTEYFGKEGDVTQNLDTAYDAIQSGVLFIPGVGQLIGGGMEVAKFLGNGLNALGAGTDGMTKQDAILGSSFFNWNFGALNGAFGKKTIGYNKDQEAFDAVRGSYVGSEKIADKAMEEQNKKYGVLSGGTRRKANRNIINALDQASRISTVADLALLDRNTAESLSNYNLYNTYNNLNGGFNYNSIRAAKRGAKIARARKTLQITTDWKPNEWESKEIQWEPNEWSSDKKPIEEFKEGGTVENQWKPKEWISEEKSLVWNPAVWDTDLEYSLYLNTLPKNQRDTTTFRVKKYWELNGKPKDFNEAKDRGMFTKEPDGWHAKSVAYNKDTDEYEFMKASNHPTIWMEEAWYNGGYPVLINKNSDPKDAKNYEIRPLEGKEKKDSDNFRAAYDLDKSGEFWKYVRKPNSFKEGGKMNVIPEGALHARLHHMDQEGITKKGIPVITEEDGKVILHAEIEVNEIVFTLEVTLKLEELMKDGSDKAAIEAGKLLAIEIIDNTEDRTGLIDDIITT